MAIEARNILLKADGEEVSQIGSPLGARMVTREIDEMIARGMGRVANTGAFSTGLVTGGDGTAIALAQPQLVIGVPVGYTIRPIRIGTQVQMGDIAEGNESEILIAVDIYGVWDGSGTVVQEDPVNMRSNLGEGSACRVCSAVTEDLTTTPAGGAAGAPVLDLELDRHASEWHVLTSSTSENHMNHVYEPRYPPFIVGPATLFVLFGGDVAPVGGFVQAAWVEGRSEEFWQ